MPFAIGAAVKDRRRDQRATTTDRRLANGRESPLSPAGSLNRMYPHPASVDGAAHSGMFFWKGRHPGPYVPDVTDGVAQDRKRQEP